MESERFSYLLKVRDQIAEERKKNGLMELTRKPKCKKIIGLSCGTKNGNCEFYLKAAAMGAEEFGVETEIIRAADLRIKPCDGCASCTRALAAGKLSVCPIKDDDVNWILQKTVVEDCGLIVSAPVYYTRSNAKFSAICERMHPTMFNYLDMMNKRKVAAEISVGGGLDGWAALGLNGLDIWIQHFAVAVDRLQVESRNRETDWFERAKKLGRNVARAMEMPVEQVKYMGEENPISCPVCHGDVMQLPDYHPRDVTALEFRYKPGNIICPICWVHGDLYFEGNTTKVKWDEWDVKHPRFSEYGIFEHLNMLVKMYNEGLLTRDKYKDKKQQLSSYGKIIKPY